MAALARVHVLAQSGGTIPPEPRQSLPVRAAKRTYRLSEKAAAVVGFIVVLAEMIAPDHAVLRAIVRALFDAP